MGKGIIGPPQLERKCKQCGKGELSHRSSDKACPLGKPSRGSFWSFNEIGAKFTDSGKFTIQSQRKLKEYEAHEARTKSREETLERERSKIRALSLDEVVRETISLIKEVSGLDCETEQRYGDSYEIHVVSPKGIRLGYTTVTKKHDDGGYIVGGTSAGCFMSSEGVHGALVDSFYALEEKANAEKR